MQYHVSFDFEMLLPVRKVKTDPRALPEPGLPIDVDKDEDDADVVVAEWPDSFKAEISDLTFGRLRVCFLQQRLTSSSVGDLLVLQHSETKHSIVVRQKVDRSLLLVAYEQNLQILMDLQKILSY